MGKKFKILGLCLAAFCLSLAFNNCAPPFLASNNDSAFRTPEEIEQDYRTQYAGKLTPELCQNSAMYSCSHKIFSPEVPDQNLAINLDCVSIGSFSLCPRGQLISFNTASATEICQNTNCTDNYNYEEFECHFVLPDLASKNSLQSTQATLSQSLNDLYEACQRITTGGPL